MIIYNKDNKKQERNKKGEAKFPMRERKKRKI